MAGKQVELQRESADGKPQHGLMVNTEAVEHNDVKKRYFPFFIAAHLFR
jgi:hypothetical protein